MERTAKRYTVNWCRYPHGIEGEAMVCHSREFCNLDTAKKFLRNRLHAIKSINWAGGWIEDEHCNWLYSIDDEGNIDDR